MQHQPTEQVIPTSLPIPQSAQSNEAQPRVRDESREVPPPVDELSVGETHELETIHEVRESAGPGMDVDMVKENTDVDFKTVDGRSWER